jgi:hypothetical protein
MKDLTDKEARELRHKIPFHLQRYGLKTRIFVRYGKIVDQATDEEIQAFKAWEDRKLAELAI